MTKEQQKKRNKPYLTRQPKMLELGNERMTLSQWSEKTGIHMRTIVSRLRAGWSVEEALTRPTDTDSRERLKERVYNYIVSFKSVNDGIPPSIHEIAKRCNTSTSNIFSVLKALEDDGLIKTVEKNSARDIRVKGAKWKAPKKTYAQLTKSI